MDWRDNIIKPGGHCIDPFSHRPVCSDAVTHPLQVVLPFDLVERCEMHEDLAVHTKVKELPDIGFGECCDLLISEIKRLKNCMTVVGVRRLQRRGPIEFVEKLLHRIQRHDHSKCSESGRGR